MENRYIEGEKFENLDFAKNMLKYRDFENCTFAGCNFANCDLSELVFTDCIFSGCDLSLAKLINSSFKDVVFKGCKLLGLQFNSCKQLLFKVDFENCLLNFS